MGSQDLVLSYVCVLLAYLPCHTLPYELLFGYSINLNRHEKQCYYERHNSIVFELFNSLVIYKVNCWYIA